MKKLLISISFLSLFLYSDAQLQWYYVSNPGMRNFSFPDMSTGYIVHSGGLGGAVKKTIDAGLTWQTIYTVEFPYTLIGGIYFINSQTGWFSTNTQVLYQTSDGGNNWKIVLNMGSSGSQILFVDDLFGWAFNYANFYRTTDGGNSWKMHSYPVSPSNSNIFFINEAIGWYAVYNHSNSVSTIYKTTNGGINWNESQSIALRIHQIFFIDKNTGWAGGLGNVIKTTDGGIIWTNQSYSLTNYINKIYFINENTGWIGTTINTSIAYTTNGGSNWISVNKPINAEVTSLKFFGNTGIGYMILGENLYKTWNNGIITNLIPINENVPSEYSLHQNFPNPFNPVTNIKFSLPNTQYTILKIFDITGRDVATLVNGKLQAGSYEFTFDANELSSGVYFYQLKVNDFVQTRKMVLTK